MNAQPIVTLTTDWGQKDFFAGMVKGRLYSQIEGVRIVDITHNIAHYDLTAASFVVRNACLEFPAGTVHLIDVDSQAPYVAIAYDGQFFICSDNGLPYTIFGDRYSAAVLLHDDRETMICDTFPAFTLFCHAVARLCNGAPLSELGAPVESLRTCQVPGFFENANELVGYVTYIDAYGNADLSIRYDDFERVRRGRSFQVQVREQLIKKISRNYQDFSISKENKTGLMLTVSATGHLQIALSRKSLEQLVGVRVLTQIHIVFSE